MWSKRASDLEDIPRFTLLKWVTYMSGCWEAPADFSGAKCHKLVEREEHHHRPDARSRCDVRWINMASFVIIFWYNLNGFLYVENV